MSTSTLLGAHQGQPARSGRALGVQRIHRPSWLSRLGGLLWFFFGPPCLR
jgi:hypothetical protein